MKLSAKEYNKTQIAREVEYKKEKKKKDWSKFVKLTVFTQLTNNSCKSKIG